MNANITSDHVPIVEHYTDGEIKREFVALDCQQTDLPTMRARALEFDGKRFSFSGWNSDTKKAYFVHFLDTIQPIAKII